MTTTNTSFEHVLHNLQERDRIIDEIKVLMNNLFNCIRNDSCKLIFVNALNGIDDRVNTIHNTYKQTIERFNIGIIAFISDYYSIVDQHSDQFHSKYLHTYSAHRSHYNPTISTSASTKFDLEELVNIFKEHCYDFKRFKLHADSSHIRRTRERTWIIYQKLSNYIASENVYDLSDALMYEFNSIVSGINNLIDTDPVNLRLKKPKKTKLNLNRDAIDIFNRLKYMIQQFNNIKLDFKPSEEMLDYCECGNVMQVMAGSSEMLCDHCGYLYELKGTVFDDNQFYSQEGTRYKHAGYEPSKHCKCWLERIQARETNTITQIQLHKIETCIKRDGITNKKRISIEQLRRYLKDTGLTELNEHVALIKRLITGVVPPQLSYAETQDITNSFSKAVKAYNIIRPSNKSNMLFYPFLLWKLIEMHVVEYSKRKSLLSFIHLQGTQTLIQNDQIWSGICNVTPGFSYRPTDRYEYMD
jgi:hypothetical protein